MVDKNYIDLERAVISISGDDAYKFLQGIITNDLGDVKDNAAIYTYLLTPQGKYLFDFFISKQGDKFLLEVAAKDKDDLLKKLKMYKLRSHVEIEDLSATHDVFAVLNNEADYYRDPRNSNMPNRVIVRKNFFPKEQRTDISTYNKLRIENNIPESADLEKDKSYPLHYRMIELHGVNFEKGCYVGQEVTTRTHRRGEVRKTTYRINSEKPLEKGADITFNNSTVGKIILTVGNSALALLEKETAENPAAVLFSNNSEVTLVN